MNDSGDRSKKSVWDRNLRQRAEESIRAEEAGDPAALSPEEIRRLVHELSVHQIELRMQNEELQRSHRALEEALARYLDLYELAPVGYITLSKEGVICQANLTAAGILGVPRGALDRQHFSHWIHREDQDIFFLHRKTLFASETPQVCEIRVMRPEGSTIWVRLDSSLVQEPESEARLCRIALSNITERRRADEVQAFLARASRGKAGEPFFEALARYLAQSLGMDFVCIDRLDGDGLTARTLAVWCDGKFEDNVTYALKDTPCGEVANQGVCFFPDNVRQLFPRDQVLQDLRAESYAGVTIWGHAGLPVGLIAVIGRQPMANRPETEAMLEMVAMRSAGELERLAFEEELRASLDEKGVLLREVHHRVKNNLASIVGLINLQKKTLADPAIRAEFDELGGRIHSMALVHEMLFKSLTMGRIDVHGYFEALASHLSDAFDPGGAIRLTVDAQVVDMDLDNAIPCGLIANELVTNAFKYAFPGGLPRPGEKECEIAVTVSWNGSEYTLEVRDNGVGIPAGFNLDTAPSLGLQLVEMLGRRQLGGQVELDRAGGTTVRLRFSPRSPAAT